MVHSYLTSSIDDRFFQLENRILSSLIFYMYVCPDDIKFKTQLNKSENVYTPVFVNIIEFYLSITRLLSGIFIF